MATVYSFEFIIYDWFVKDRFRYLIPLIFKPTQTLHSLGNGERVSLSMPIFPHWLCRWLCMLDLFILWPFYCLVAVITGRVIHGFGWDVKLAYYFKKVYGL